MKIIDYSMIEADSLNGLIRETKRSMAQGWQPLGGVATQGHFSYYLQAMVKYEEEQGKYNKGGYTGPG